MYWQVCFGRDFRYVVAARNRQNADIFPFDNVMDPTQCSYPGYIRCRLENKFNPENSPHFFYKYFQRERIRLLHSHFLNHGCADLWIRKRLAVPHIVSTYGFDMTLLPNESSVWLKRYRRLFREASFFIVEGPAAKETMVSLGCPEEKVRIIRIGVPLDEMPFQPVPNSEDKIKILMAAAFRPKKGFPVALKAFAIACKKLNNLELTIVGDVKGEAREHATKAEMMEIIRSNKLEDRIRFMGYIPQSELIGLARNHHIFFHPSQTAEDGDQEGGSPVVITMMAALGVPVIATRHCDIPRAVIDGESGFLTAERDVEGLADRLITLASDQSLRRQMAIAGRKHIEADFDAHKSAAEREALYHECLD